MGGECELELEWPVDVVATAGGVSDTLTTERGVVVPVPLSTSVLVPFVTSGDCEGDAAGGGDVVSTEGRGGGDDEVENTLSGVRGEGGVKMLLTEGTNVATEPDEPGVTGEGTKLTKEVCGGKRVIFRTSSSPLCEDATGCGLAFECNLGDSPGLLGEATVTLFFPKGFSLEGPLMGETNK